jgi:CBS domain-containing protein
MSRDVICIDKNRKLSDAVNLMEKKEVSRLVVTSDGKVCGMLTEKDIAKHLGSAKHGKALASSLHVSTAMTSDPVILQSGEDVKKAAKLMLDNGISSLPVIRGEEIVGIITKTDLMKILQDSEEKIEEAMTEGVVTISPGERVVHARRIMLDKGITRLVVVEGDKIVGILTEGDAARAFLAFRKAADKYQYSRVRNMIVEDIITQGVKTLNVKAKVGEAAKMMLQNNFSGLPITDGDKLVGIVTKTDLAKLI